ncbi:MAG: hypothetical protein EXR72_09050 [Myxococcales bacterium]|nr:hypothetical protein [Myxococcales bacterium]
MPAVPRWQAPDLAALRGSRIYQEKRVDNRAAIERLLDELTGEPEREFWLAVVPGCSEANGHHKAWISDPDDEEPKLVEPQFECRLDRAFRLLACGAVRALVVSGGSIDAAAPDYNEGTRGRAQILIDHEEAWRRSPFCDGESLAERLIVDPWAIHSTSNVRNGDRLSVLLGLDRNLVVTTSGTFRQGWWFTSTTIGSFSDVCYCALGYCLGDFRRLDIWPERPGEPPPAFATDVILHWDLRPADLLADPRWE